MKSIKNSIPMYFHKITWRLLPCICAVCLLLCACTQQSESTLSVIPPITALETIAPAQTETVLNLSMPVGEESCNPYQINSYKTQSLLNLVYETPIVLDSAGKPSPYLFSGWQVLDNGDVCFTLRKNVTFHNGEPLKASNIANLLDKIRSDGEGSPYSYVMNTAWKWSASEDETKITITPRRGLYPLLMSLTFPVTDGTGTSGTGPYRIASFHAGEGMSLTYNENWWMKAPNIQTIHVRALANDDAQLQSLAIGEIDLMLTRSDKMAASKSSQKYSTLQLKTGSFEFVCFQTYSSAMADTNLRKAIAYGINRKDLITNIYQGSAISADLPIALDSWMYPETLPVFEQDIPAAKRYLALAGYQDKDGDGLIDVADPITGERVPLELTLVTNSDASTSLHKDAALRIAKQLLDLGLLVNVEALPQDDLEKRLSEKSFDLAYLGAYVYEDPDFSSFYASTGAFNYGDYESTQMQTLLLARDSAKTEADFLSATENIVRLALEDLPIMGVCFKTGFVFYSPQLSNLAPITWRNPFITIDRWSLEAK